MDINKLYNYCKTISDCGMNKVVFRPEYSELKISAIDDDGMVGVYHTVGNEDTVTSKIGLSDLKPFVKKMELLDLENTVVEESFVDMDNDTYTKSILMRHNSKSIVHTFSNPSKVTVPIAKPPSLVSVVVEMDYDETNKIKKAINTFNPSIITFKSDGKVLSIEFSDDNNDTYSQEIMEYKGNIQSSYKKEKFLKLLNMKNTKDDGSSFGIADVGLIYFVINDIAIMLAPLVD